MAVKGKLKRRSMKKLMIVRVVGQIVGLMLTLGMASLVQAQGDAEAGRGKIAVCVACHGAGGNDNLLPGVPAIGGQNEKYLLKQMQDIKNGERPVPLMIGMLNALNDQDMADMAAYFASQELPLGATDPSLLDLGESLYRAGIASIGVAACSACHSPTGRGNAGAGYPALRGQDSAYIATQLRAFRAGERQTDKAEIMQILTARLKDVEINALASYVSGLR